MSYAARRPRSASSQIAPDRRKPWPAASRRPARRALTAAQHPASHGTNHLAMPLQNRVTPLGELIADPARGLVYGNRGCLHDARRRIRRDSRCGAGSPVGWSSGAGSGAEDATGRFTELFFLDDATALAAGRRPCALPAAARTTTGCSGCGEGCTRMTTEPTRSTCGCTNSASTDASGVCMRSPTTSCRTAPT